MTSPMPDLNAEDFYRSYDLAPVLVPTLGSSIPTRAQPGEPGTHWVGRGLMVETCAQLLGHPVRLGYSEGEHLTVVTAEVSLASTSISSDPRDSMVTVDLLIAGTGRWVLLSGDRLIGTGPHVPSPRHLAGLVAADRDARRRPASRLSLERITPPW